MPRRIRSTAWLTGRPLLLAPRIRHAPRPAEPHVEMRAHLLGLSRSTRAGAGMTALYINMSIDIKGQDESADVVSPVPEMGDIESAANPSAQTPTVCALGFAASNCLSTYCKIPPLA